MPVRASFSRSGARRALLGLFGVIMLAWPALAGEAEGGLRSQIETLAADHEFSVVGLERLQATPARPLDEPLDEPRDDADPVRSLRSLLAGYNYLLVHEADGGIQRLRILGPRVPAGSRTTVETRPRGSHQLVETVLVGPNGVPRTASLLLDTGASLIMLPRSMIDGLGFDPDSLESGTANTANGPVAIRIGKLRRVRVGRAEVSDVAVGFIADDKIGDQHLLGMSFLEHFRMVLDDEANRLTLLAK